MTHRWLLDTNALSETLREAPDPRIEKWLLRHGQEAATAAPVIQELRFGASLLPASRRRDRLEHFIENLLRAYDVLPYDLAAAEWHGRERARLVRAGHTPPISDGIIAAIAATNDLILITANLKDFRAFEGLRVESWRK